MNRVYEIDEGRPIWKLRPVLLVVTVVLVLIAVVIVTAVVLSGEVARAVGDAVGLSDVTVTVWSVAKWPVIVALVVVAIARPLLRHAERAAAEVPVDQPRARSSRSSSGCSPRSASASTSRTSAATATPTARWPA